MHLKEIVEKADEKVSEARHALNTGTMTKAEQAARLKTLNAAITERDQADDDFRRAGGLDLVPLSRICIESLIPVGCRRKRVFEEVK